MGVIRGAGLRRPGRELQRRSITASTAAAGALVLWGRDSMFVRSACCDRTAGLIRGNTTGALACVFVGRNVGQLGKGDVSRRPNGARADRLGGSNSRASRCVRLVDALRDLGGAFSPRFKQNASLFAPVRWGRGEATSHWGQTPFLDIAFDEHEAHLAKIDMNAAGTVGANGREKVLRPVVMHHILEFLPVASEEYCARSGSVAHSNDIALEQRRAVRRWRKWLVVSAVAC